MSTVTGVVTGSLKQTAWTRRVRASLNPVPSLLTYRVSSYDVDTSEQTVWGDFVFAGNADLSLSASQTLSNVVQSATTIGFVRSLAAANALTGVTQSASISHVLISGSSGVSEVGRYWRSPVGTGLTVLQRHLPTGPAWDAYRTAGKNLYKLISALAKAYDDASAALCRMVAELDPRTTKQMLTEWETAVSLPDACLPTATTIEQRRAWVLWRLTKRRWNTAQDWHDLAALFGLTIRVTPGWLVQKPALYAALYPKRYDLFPKLGRFRVYIDVLDQKWRGYPYSDPFTTGNNYPIWYGTGGDYSGFRCLIERVAPANVLIIWNEFPPVSPNGNGITFSPDFSEDFS